MNIGGQGKPAIMCGVSDGLGPSMTEALAEGANVIMSALSRGQACARVRQTWRRCSTA